MAASDTLFDSRGGFSTAGEIYGRLNYINLYSSTSGIKSNKTQSINMRDVNQS